MRMNVTVWPGGRIWKHPIFRLAVKGAWFRVPPGPEGETKRLP
jgi:hypothetical protein